MKTAVLGVSSSKFGELWDVSPRTLVSQTANEVLKASQLSIADIDAIYVGNMLSGILGNQENLGSFFAEELGANCAAFKVEGACASGGLAFHNAYLGIKSGAYDRVLVIGVEKMTDHKPDEVASGLMGAGSEEERVSGITFPGLYAIMARAYINKYKIPKEYLASVAVKNHYHGSLNPKAQFQRAITIEKALQSTMISDPLTLLDCSPISDGASAAVLVNEKNVGGKNKPVWVIGSGVATDSLGLSKRDDITSLKSARLAAIKAYKQANVKPADIDIAEVHDCFTIAEIMALEDLGFYQKGKSGKAIFEEKLTLGRSKELVVNTSGGLKACGHPVGATGVKQIVEVVEQLRGKADKRQVEDVRIGLTHNVGGSGAVAVVNIFKRAKDQ
ncbi:thiolase domain-containing protein [Candidatus Gottesmanbacteria bacterium]|nr:thiolase domain-containing protein [Candidatus Gottesmanbacteria bacterium]